MLNQPKLPTPEKKVDKDKGKVDTLAPEKKGDKGKGKIVKNLISHDQIERSLNEGSTCYALVAREAEPESEMQVPGHIKPILEELSEVLPEDMSGELPPMWDIQHAIDLVLWANLLNLPHYKMTLLSKQSYNDG